jgi:hypothetical protein
LIIRNFMTRFVYSHEAEVAILANLAILSAIYNHGLVTCATELLAMSIVDSETDGLATKPVA